MCRYVIVALQFSLLRAPGTERPFRTDFCAKSAFPSAAVIRNDTAAPRKRFCNSRRLVSTSFRPERAKEDTAGEAQLFYLRRRARFRAISARCALLPSRFESLLPFLSAGAPFWILWLPRSDSSRLGVYVSGLGTSIRETARTLEQKTLSPAAPPTPTLAGLKPILARHTRRPSARVLLSEMTSCGRDALPARGSCGDWRCLTRARAVVARR